VGLLFRAGPCYKFKNFSPNLMKRRLLIVFSGMIALAVGLPATAQDPATLDASKLKLASANVLVVDAAEGTPIYAKAANEVTPIASVTKLMTAIVTLDAGLPLDEVLSIDSDDQDTIKGTRSRLVFGTELTRREMLQLALMASENRAASSLARHYPGGMPAFIEAMNIKATLLGMTSTHFSDPTGLSAENVSTARDLATLVGAAAGYPLIRQFTTTESHYVEVAPKGRLVGFNNTNGLVKNSDWDIQVSKTGFIREAGKCLVMMATISSRPVVIVLLDSLGRYTRVADAMRVKYWLETGETMPTPTRSVRASKPAKTKRATGRTRYGYKNASQVKRVRGR